jgi:hypothetical protein
VTNSMVLLLDNGKGWGQIRCSKGS